MTETAQAPEDRGPNDEELMLAFCRGSEPAFVELFHRYRQPIFGFFRRRMMDAGRAEELTQETFVAVLRGATSWEPKALFRTYLYAIAWKLLQADRRKAAFRAAFFGQSQHEPAAPDNLGADLLLRDAVGRLKHIDREVLMLREFEELSYAEIAELLRLPVNTVRSRLLRARMALKQLLEAPAPHAPATVKQIEEHI